jgi:hypothetical protein
MPADVVICDFCRQGNVTKSEKEFAFRQMSKRGYVHCRVTTFVGVCDHCGSWSCDEGIDKILEDAFQREYSRLSER